MPARLRCWSTPTAICRRQHLYCPTYKNATWRQELFGCWLVHGCGVVELCQPHVEIGQFRRLLKMFLFERDCHYIRIATLPVSEESLPPAAADTSADTCDCCLSGDGRMDIDLSSASSCLHSINVQLHQTMTPQHSVEMYLPTEIQRRGTTFEHYRRLLKAFLFV